MVQENLFGVNIEKTEEDIETEKRAKQFEITALDINVEDGYIAIIDFEDEEDDEYPTKIFKTLFTGHIEFNKKTKKEKVVLVRTFWYKGLEEKINGFCDDIDFKSEKELNEFLDGELGFNAFQREQNKKHIYWDSRRYFWKREKTGVNDDECWKKVLPVNPPTPINHLEQKIKEISDELKELLKKKYGSSVIIRVMKGGKEEDV